jgi:sarcosine oxidase subunit beta
VNCGLAREAVAFYGELEERLGRRVDARLERCGYLFVALSEDALASLRGNVLLQNRLGVPSRIAAPTEMSELVPGLAAEAVVGGAWCERRRDR